MTALVTLTHVTVRWVSESGKAFEVEETVTANTGATWPRKWGVVLEGHGLTVGDVVSVVGEYSDKIDEYQGKHYTKRTLWNPTVTPVNETTGADTPF